MADRPEIGAPVWRCSWALVALCACHGVRQRTAPRPPSDRVALIALVDSATALMQRFSIKRAEVDWPGLRTTARAAVQQATAPDTGVAYGAIRKALATLGDHHSFVLPPEQTQRLSQAGAAENQLSEVRLLRPGVGYAKIPPYLGMDSVQIGAYAAHVQAQLRELGPPEPCAWVVDLRGNVGGNMWPMLAGIGPILGDGTAGLFVSADTVSPWGYNRGAAWMGRDTLVRLTDPVNFQSPPAVAVLTDSLTASSGEAIAISFRGRLNTRSFGALTRGLTTGNDEYLLPDGSMLFLTTVIDADRTGRQYGGRLEPDEVTSSAQALDAAVAWLQDAAGC